ncbi:MAG TPA: DUF2269 family protein [Actinomycetota bacterium]|nr:DUF2269 family protein [Actinomycetota bacterium]
MDEREEHRVITFFDVMKFLHVTFAIIAVGFNASYGIWLARAARQPEHQTHVLRGVTVLDRIANLGYALLLATGLIMVATSPFELTTFWIALALALYALAIVIGLVVYTPTLRKQIQTLGAEGPDSAEFVRLSNRGRIVGILLAIDVLVIVFLMVTKPTL